MYITNPLQRITLIFSLYLCVFMSARYALYWLYSHQFTDLSTLEIVTAFLYGLRFDVSTTIITIGIPALLMLLPLKIAQQRFWQQLLLWIIFALLILTISALVADLIYFGFVQRHVGAEITLISGDIPLMIDIAINEYRYVTLCFILSSIILAYIWYWALCQMPDQQTYSLGTRSVTLLTLLCLFVLLGRGGLQYKPIGIGDAFALGSTSSGYLVLNGMFSLQHALISGTPKQKTFMSTDAAEQIVQRYIRTPNDVFESPDYPLLRTQHTINIDQPKPNIVIILLESWDAIHIDVLRQSNNLPSLGVTPNFDLLSQQGVLFSHFYATGQRSIDGLAAILASMPTLPGMPYLGKGLEQSRLAYLGHMAQQNQYQTIFLQTSHRGSFHIDAIAAQAGFQQYYGAEDLPEQHPEASQKHDWGAWDYDTFHAAHQIFKQTQQPFLGFIFTSTTHNPWRIPTKQWQKYPPTSDKNNYLNTLYYADWALGEFFTLASAADYYQNTIFVLTADHISPFDLKGQHLPNRYHIPLLILAPNLPPSLNAATGSQLDIIPTLLDLAQLNAKHASLGQSLFSLKDKSRGIFSVNGNIIDWVQPNAWVSHNLNQIIDTSPALSPKQQQHMQQQLLAVYQTTLTLLLENRVYTH